MQIIKVDQEQLMRLGNLFNTNKIEINLNVIEIQYKEKLNRTKKYIEKKVLIDLDKKFIQIFNVGETTYKLMDDKTEKKIYKILGWKYKK